MDTQYDEMVQFTPSGSAAGSGGLELMVVVRVLVLGCEAAMAAITGQVMRLAPLLLRACGTHFLRGASRLLARISPAFSRAAERKAFLLATG